MTRMKRAGASRKRVETAPVEAKGEGAGKGEAERYAGAFERVRLVRAWIAVVAAVVAMASAYVNLLERVDGWMVRFPETQTLSLGILTLLKGTSTMIPVTSRLSSRTSGGIPNSRS